MKNIVLLLLVGVLFFSCNPITERMDGYEVHGIDVSHYQANIDWTKVAQQNISFAFVKASEGETLKDSLFLTNWNALKKEGIYRGAYHFFRPSISATAQALHFIEQVDLEKGDLPPVLDIEVMDGVSEERLISGLKKWLSIVENEYQIRPIIYTNLNYYQKHLAAHFSDYPMWIARYSEHNPRLNGNQKWQFWQYGDRGQIKGIDGFVDFNVFAGSIEELEAMTIMPTTYRPILEEPSISIVW